MKQDLPSLYSLAYAMAFFHEGPLELFPYEFTTMHIIVKEFGRPINSSLKAFLMYYYLEVASKAVFAQSFIYVAVHQYMKATLQVRRTQSLILVETACGSAQVD